MNGYKEKLSEWVRKHSALKRFLPPTTAPVAAKEDGGFQGHWCSESAIIVYDHDEDLLTDATHHTSAGEYRALCEQQRLEFEKIGAKLVFIDFDRENYQHWLGENEDNLDNRNLWAGLYLL